MTRREYVFVIAILAIGWAFWLHRMGVNDHDDAVSNELLFARKPMTAIVLNNPWPDQSPLYFLVLHGVRRFGDTPFDIQLFNALLLTLTLASTYALGRAVSSSAWVARGAIFLGAISPASLWLVRNGRMYSIQVLLSILGLISLLAYLEEHRPRDLAVFTVVCVLNIYNHFAGFLITAVLLLPLGVDAGSRARRLREQGVFRVWQSVLPAALAAFVMLVLALPQIYRLISLLGNGPPIRQGLSAPGLSGGLLDQVGWFWFVNADWGSLRRGGPVVIAIYGGSIGILAAAGLAGIRRRHGLIAALCIVVPLLGLGLAASRMDVRLRYFVWVLPILWVAISAGAVGPLPSRRVSGAAVEAAKGVRCALAVAVIAGSLWLLWHKLPERYPQWTKLMLGLALVYRPSMAVYMSPGPATGTPRLLGEQLGLPAGLADIQSLTIDTRGQFLHQIRDARDFVFLVHWSYENAEMAWRTGYLAGHGYRRIVLPVWGARAEIFARGDIELSRRQQIERHPSAGQIMSWTTAKLRARQRPPVAIPRLSDALVARIESDGTIEEARLFTSQHGEDGSWRVSERESDVVNEMRAASNGTERPAIVARPTDDVLVVALPAMEMKRSMSFSYGLTDHGLRLGPPGEVRVSLYLNGKNVGDVMCPAAAGWHELTVGTGALRGTPADVVLLMTGTKDYGSEFAFQLVTSSRTMPPVRLTGGRTLKDSVDQLTVYRMSGAYRIDARHETDVRSASEMHEAAGPSGEGGVSRRWVLGPALWDAVGVTRQRSDAWLRDGVWAHPRNGTTLVIEAPTTQLRGLLRGYFGLTDFSTAKATETGVAAPVRLRILLDNATLVDATASRRRGWQQFAVPILDERGARRLRVEIDCAHDSWAHFVFDLWTE